MGRFWAQVRGWTARGSRVDRTNLRANSVGDGMGGAEGRRSFGPIRKCLPAGTRRVTPAATWCATRRHRPSRPRTPRSCGSPPSGARSRTPTPAPAEREATERRKANRESFADYGRRWLAERKSFSGQPLRADAQGLRADPRDSPRAHLGHAGRRGHHQRLRPAVARRLRQVEQARPDQGVRPAASDHEHGDRTS